MGWTPQSFRKWEFQVPTNRPGMNDLNLVKSLAPCTPEYHSSYELKLRVQSLLQDQSLLSGYTHLRLGGCSLVWGLCVPPSFSEGIQEQELSVWHRIWRALRRGVYSFCSWFSWAHPHGLAPSQNISSCLFGTRTISWPRTDVCDSAKFLSQVGLTGPDFSLKDLIC